MRIALLPSAYAPAVGGVEELTRHLARRYAMSGDEVEVWTPQCGAERGEEEIDGIRVRRFAMPLPPAQIGPLARFPGPAAGTLGALRKAVRRFQPDLLHVQCFSVNGVYATAAAAVEGIPLAITLQGETVMDDHDIFDRSIALRTGLRLAVRRAAAVTGCSQFVLDDAMKRFGLDEDKGQVIFNGVDLSESFDPPVFTPPFERFVFCLGRMVWKKGFDLMLDAFARVAERLPDVGLVIGGDGAYRPQLEARTERLGLGGRVDFPGNLDRARVSAMMASACAFVLPSRIEPFGIVVLEAWRAGCPAVVSAFGGTQEFVTDGMTGIVADPYDSMGLAGTLTNLLADRELGERLAQNAAERVKDFDWSVVAGRYRDLYASIVR